MRRSVTLIEMCWLMLPQRVPTLPLATAGSMSARSLVAGLAAWEEWGEEIEEMRDLGSRVLVLSVQRGRAKGSGAEMEARFAILYDLYGGEITGMRMFATLADALEAVGLRE
jgi:hypothetical protein